MGNQRVGKRTHLSHHSGDLLRRRQHGLLLLRRPERRRRLLSALELPPEARHPASAAAPSSLPGRPQVGRVPLAVSPPVAAAETAL